MECSIYKMGHYFLDIQYKMILTCCLLIHREREAIPDLPKKTEPLLYDFDDVHDIKELDEIDVRSDLSDAEPEVNVFFCFLFKLCKNIHTTKDMLNFLFLSFLLATLIFVILQFKSQ